MSKPQPSYRYRAIVRRVTDGDTIRADFDLGFGVWLHDQTIRLIGIDAPDYDGTDEGRKRREASRCHLQELIVRYATDQADALEDQQLVIETHKGRDKDKYGRWLGILLGYTPQEGTVDINARMLADGKATDAPQSWG